MAHSRHNVWLQSLARYMVPLESAGPVTDWPIPIDGDEEMPMSRVMDSVINDVPQYYSPASFLFQAEPSHPQFYRIHNGSSLVYALAQKRAWFPPRIFSAVGVVLFC
jgi:hypothetical protein